MEEVFNTLKEFITGPQLRGVLRALLILSVGLLLSGVISRRIRFSFVPTQRLFLIRQVTKYLIVAITFVWSLRELGFDLNLLLGAAGILTVAVGFASQTSASNLISGFFLMGEQPFGVGDIIRVADVTGEVLTIDPLSVKLRTFDNLMVRIPNETMLKSNVTNMTRFPIRRIDLQIGIAYKESIPRVHDLLLTVADQNPLCLEEPVPLVIMLGYGDSSIDLQFSVWTKRENFLVVRNAMYSDIKAVFDQEGVEIPFPHRSVYVGSATAPMPVQIIRDQTSR